MAEITAVSPRERIVRAALELLETGGREAVSTRAVSAAADVQVPTIYRHFGDMDGLLDAVAQAGYAAYLERKHAPSPDTDPIEELRQGWANHLEFGSSHPHLYALMYGATGFGAASPAARQAFELLHDLMERIAATGRLAVSVERAAATIHAAAVGVTLTADPHTRASDLSGFMLETVLAAILTAAPGLGSEPNRSSEPLERQASAHAVALTALLPGIATNYSDAEARMLTEWLHRLT